MLKALNKFVVVIHLFLFIKLNYQSGPFSNLIYKNELKFINLPKQTMAHSQGYMNMLFSDQTLKGVWSN